MAGRALYTIGADNTVLIWHHSGYGTGHFTSAPRPLVASFLDNVRDDDYFFDHPYLPLARIRRKYRTHQRHHYGIPAWYRASARQYVIRYRNYLLI